MDEVGFWGKALTQTEITDLYNGGSGQTMVVAATGATRKIRGIGITR